MIEYEWRKLWHMDTVQVRNMRKANDQFSFGTANHITDADNPLSFNMCDSEQYTEYYALLASIC